MDKRTALIERSLPFLEEIRNMTAGSEVEAWLNRTHGPGSPLYRDLAALVKDGIDEGWAANVEIQGRRYRRSRIAEPSAQTLHFSITAVYMDSRGNTQGHADERFRGDYHAH